MLSASVKAMNLEYNPNAEGMQGIHLETLAQDIRIFLMAQGAIIVRKRVMSWQIVGI